MSQDDLTEQLLAKPTAPAISGRKVDPDKDFTRNVEVKGDTAEVTLRGTPEQTTDEAAAAYLRSKGEDPDLWEPTGFRSGEWTMANGSEGVSNRYTFRRRPGAEAERPPLDELFAEIKKHKPRKTPRPEGDHGALVDLGDMQFGKIDGDGVEGTLRRTIDCLNEAANRIETHRQRFDIGHIEISWLGDHIEGFVSQGGANVWRTPLTLNEQIRLTRRVMLHALTTFAPMAERVSMVAVPGNHGEPQRFAGKGITRYDDSHDTESLIAVQDAVQLNLATYGHVRFYVPDTDRLTVVTQVADTTIAHAHGHQWKPGKHFEWWRGQAFHDPSLHAADLLSAGHLHHLLVEMDGHRLFAQAPAMESESTWFLNSKGTPGNPGLLLRIVRDKQVKTLEVVQ